MGARRGDHCGRDRTQGRSMPWVVSAGLVMYWLPSMLVASFG